MKRNKGNVLADTEKVMVLNALASKGYKKPSNYKLIHSEICDENEDLYDYDSYIKKVVKSYGEKLSVSTVSNPNESSRLDYGQYKVRFRYVLSPLHAGEATIKENSREFCQVLIGEGKLYRIEDINIMSFRGVNPITNKNYSIFKLKGHWNCRHAWQREVYIIERDNQEVGNNPIVEQNILLKMKKKLFEMARKLSNTNVKLTDAEKLELSEMIAKKAADANLKFLDAVSGDTVMKIEGEELTVGASVTTVDAEGNEVETADGTYEVKVGEKDFSIVIKDSMIESFAEVVATAEGEQFNAEKSYGDLIKKLDDISSRLPKKEDSVDAKMTKAIKDLKAEMSEIIDEKLSKAPAFKNRQQAYSSQGSGFGDILERSKA